MFLGDSEVELRPVESSDLPQLRDWRNSPGLRPYLRERFPLNMSNQARWFESLSNRQSAMFVIDFHGESVGTCGLVHIDFIDRKAEYSYYIGVPAAMRKGLGYRVARLLFAYGFGELGLHRITSEDFTKCYAEIDVKWGFRLEGVLRKAHLVAGRWRDSYILSVLEGEWSH